MSDTQSVTPSSLNNNKDGIKSKDESDCYIVDIDFSANTSVSVMISGASSREEAEKVIRESLETSGPNRDDLWCDIHAIANLDGRDVEFNIIPYQGYKDPFLAIKVTDNYFGYHYPGYAMDIIKHKDMPVINAKTGEVTCAKR